MATQAPLHKLGSFKNAPKPGSFSVRWLCWLHFYVLHLTLLNWKIFCIIVDYLYTVASKFHQFMEMFSQSSKFGYHHFNHFYSLFTQLLSFSSGAICKLQKMCIMKFLTYCWTYLLLSLMWHCYSVLLKNSSSVTNSCIWLYLSKSLNTLCYIVFFVLRCSILCYHELCFYVW